MMSSFKVAVAQLNSVPGDVEANLIRAIEMTRDAANNGAKLVVFPECYLQGYCADELFASTAVPLEGEACNRLAEVAKDHDIYVVMGLARSEDQFPHLVYNSAAVIGPEGLVGSYDKTHLGTYLAYREGVYFAPGKHIPVFDLPFARIGVQICYDISFPEVSRVLALNGADINIVLSAGPDEFRESWDALLRVRSSENAIWTVYANTVGHQKTIHFFGGSRVVGPDGRTRAHAGEDTETCLIAEISLAEMRLLRRQTLRFRDRVPSLYQPITEGSTT
ncbi:MAG: carbon-nitrogen hydrolase family protein [Thermomicrobiales bacterium]|nr:carbon-nitrogen hydrolase family protein [Thermomicrobiales bacterium]